MKTEFEKLKNEYYNDSFQFKNFHSNYTTIYEKKYLNKTVTIYGRINYRTALNPKETLSSLDSEIEITNIFVENKNN